MTLTDFRKTIEDTIVVCDGAMGTLIYSRGVHLSRCFDEVNLSNPYLVEKIHLDYINAGARLIETNTFGANSLKLERHALAGSQKEIIAAGVGIARKAAADDGVYVAGSVGPLGAELPDAEQAREVLAGHIGLLLEEGVDLLMLETFYNPEELFLALETARALDSSVPVVASAVFDEDLRCGELGPADIARRCEELGADAVGANCRLSADLMAKVIEQMRETTALPLSAMPDAGQGRLVDDRDMYVSTPEFVAEYMRRMLQASGVKLAGGCCGTSPAHIRAISSTVRMLQPGSRTVSVRPRSEDRERGDRPATVPWSEKTAFARKMAAGRFVSSVEIRPPRGLDDSKIAAALEGLRRAGVDAMNIPDGPRATARMNPMHIASRLNRRPDEIEVIVHLTCRDRNLLGLQADLLGVWSLGLRNVLAVTGDPPKLGDYPDATAVFDVDSIGLVSIIDRLNHGEDLGGRPLGRATAFLTGVGVNPGALNLDEEVRRLHEKIDAGAEYVFTQPVFDLAYLDRFLDRAGEIPVPVLGGYYPLYSFRNAEFLHNEVPGMSIPDDVLRRMKEAGSGPSAQDTGVEIAREALAEIHHRVQGAYIMPPFDKWELAVRVLDGFIEPAPGEDS